MDASEEIVRTAVRVVTELIQGDAHQWSEQTSRVPSSGPAGTRQN
jgi:hypothetical protein